MDRWENADETAGGRYSPGRQDGRLRPQAVDLILAARCAAAGLEGRDGRRYSGHSLRRGGATSMMAAGMDPLHVSRHGRWSDKSREFTGYVEEATGFGPGNPTYGLL